MALFTFNEEEAMAGSSVSGQYIKESGAHTGSFSEAYEVTSQGGAMGIYLNFLSDTGEQATLTLWTVGKTGNPIEFTLKKIQSLMGLLGLKTIREKKNTPIKKWDYDTKGQVDARVTSYPEIENKHIGVFFEARENIYQGKTSIRPEIIIFYDAETDKTYAEKAKNLDASTLADLIEKTPGVVAAKAAVPVVPAAPEPPKNNIATGFDSTPPPPPVDDEWDDNIPF